LTRPRSGATSRIRYGSGRRRGRWSSSAARRAWQAKYTWTPAASWASRVLRRVSGGAAVVAGPGCLMYALLLSCQRRPELGSIAGTHQFVLNAMAAGLAHLVPGLRCRGTQRSDAGRAEGFGKQPAGAAHARALPRHAVIRLPLGSHRPLPADAATAAGYRQARPHGEFVTNLPCDGASLRAALRATWDALETVADWAAGADRTAGLRALWPSGVE